MRFDWTTLALQTINLVVLVWLMQHFLFKPITAIIARRKEAAKKLLAEAAALRDEAKAQSEQAAMRERALAADGDRLLGAARESAEAERAALLHQAQAEAAAAREAKQAGLQQERGQIRRELEEDARRLAVTIATRLLDRIPAQAASIALLQQLEPWLATVPAATLQGLAGPDGTLEVATAAALDADTQASCAGMLRRRLDTAGSFRFTVDPSLLAGVELRGPHGCLRNNWRADLDRIAEELSREDQNVAVA